MTVDREGDGVEVISYERAKALAADKNPDVRRDLAGREDVAPEVLYFLAEDQDPSIRQVVAANRATPVHAGLILARDPEMSVRQALAEKVARLRPDFDPESLEKAERYVVGTLEALAQDEAVKVRRVLAEALYDLSNAPTGVIHRLAEDVEDTVACLILEGSPLLSDADLLSIIAKNTASTRLQSVSRRPNLSAEISDAIVAQHDVAAVAALLANKSAQIREQTLDLLVSEAAEQPRWHEPLVERPELSPESVEKLASFVMTSLFAKLENHPALDAESARKVTEAVKARLENENVDTEDAIRAEVEAARAAYEAGELDAESLSDALIEGRKDYVIEGLALLAEKPRDFIDRVMESTSVKTITAVAWKAGLSMRLATQIQFQLSGVMPKNALYARSDGGYPISEEEMNWQIEFFENLDEPAIAGVDNG